ncbi:unnamed protein product, partial [Ixodes persulcatus]
MEFVKTERGANMLLYGGHSYTCNKKTESSMYWVCRKRDICKAKLYTDVAMTSVLLQPGEHTHSGDPVENSLLAVRDDMKAKAGKRRALPNHQILLGAAAASSDAVASRMPSVSTMRRTLRKQRRRAIHPYTIPTTKRNLEIPVEFKVTLRGEDFLLHDSGFGDSERILVFSTAENLRKLGESELWFADGTFK